MCGRQTIRHKKLFLLIIELFMYSSSYVGSGIPTGIAVFKPYKRLK